MRRELVGSSKVDQVRKSLLCISLKMSFHDDYTARDASVMTRCFKGQLRL